MKEYPCIESTIEVLTRYQKMDTTIRLWINKDKLDDGNFKERELIVEKIHKYMKRKSYNPTLEEFVKTILKIAPKTNAVQLLSIHPMNSARYGTVIYTVDFSEDVHG